MDFLRRSIFELMKGKGQCDGQTYSQMSINARLWWWNVFNNNVWNGSRIILVSMCSKSIRFWRRYA